VIVQATEQVNTRGRLWPAVWLRARGLRFHVNSRVLQGPVQAHSRFGTEKSLVHALQRSV